MDTLFDKDFYPTPREVIEKMLYNVDVRNKFVLEPSAGAGAIVDVLKEMGAKHVIACETDKDMRRLLSTKCEVVADDFLTLTKDDVAAVQLIVANVPFSDQSRHISHIFEIAPDGCEIITLCNDSLFDSYHNSQNELQIREKVETWGWHESLGPVFRYSARPTDVRVGMIHVFKPRTGDNIFDDYFIEDEDEPQAQAAGLMPYNEVRDYVNRYVEAMKRFDSVIAANKGINDLISVFGDSGITFGAFARSERYDSSRYAINRNQFRVRLQKQAWRHVFNKLGMNKYLTSSTMRDLDAAISHQENFPFTMRNIYKMLELLVCTHQDRMKRCVVEAFDTICSFSSENSTAGEKWKTNSDYMVNRKFIVPYICSYDQRWDYDRPNVRISWESSSRMDDIVKALCTVTGKRYEDVGDSLHITAEHHKWGEKFDWTFFVCKGFKKGTMHFEFKNEDTWAAFNRTVAEIKGWKLPKNTRKTQGNWF